MHFGRGIIHGHATGLLLFLFFRIVGCQIGRNALPGLAVIARTKEKLSADINRPLFVRRKCDWRIPVEPELFLVIGPWLDVASFVRVAIYPADLATLILSVDVIGISGIRKHPEAIAVVHVFPLRIGDPAGMLRFAHERAVVL